MGRTDVTPRVNRQRPHFLLRQPRGELAREVDVAELRDAIARRLVRAANGFFKRDESEAKG